MNHTAVVVIGAGQAGLAVSNRLTEASVDHVVLERGRTAQRWRSRQWESLRLLTPNWMSRLPGWSYRGPDPSGFMPAGSVADYLSQYAESFGAPVVPGAEVVSVSWRRGAFVVVTGVGAWTADSVVIATGYADESAVPRFAEGLHPALRQLTPNGYRHPGSVADGGVLVVGASASGVQLADELAAAGHPVVLSVGRHTRMTRRYRGVDIMWWLDAMGSLDRPVDHRASGRPEPSLQLVGDRSGRDVDLLALSGRGVTLTGRVLGADARAVALADDLPLTTAAADARFDRLLTRIDRYAASQGLASEVDPATRPAPSVPHGADVLPARLDLLAHGIRSVIWATGYRRRYPWLRLPVLDAAGEIRHTAGQTSVPGLMVVGMAHQTRRNSTFLDGVRHDAATVVDHLLDEVGLGSARRRAS